MGFDYFYGRGTEPFAFLQVPRVLIEDERFADITTDAKFLYSFMLNRSFLSARSGWFPWLREVDSLALCNAQLHLQTAYKNFFRDSSVGFPKFKSKKNPVRSYTTNCVNGNITLQNGKLKLPKADWICIKQHRSIDDRYTLKGATVSQEADDKYYVSLLYAAEEPEHEIRPIETTIGLDFSMSELYVDSNRTHADYPHFFRKSQENLQESSAG